MGRTIPLLVHYLVLIFSAFVNLHHMLSLGKLQYLHCCWPSFPWFDWNMSILLGKWFSPVHSTGLYVFPTSILGILRQDVLQTEAASAASFCPPSRPASSFIYQSVFICSSLLRHWLWLSDPLSNCLQLQCLLRGIRRHQGSNSPRRQPVTEDLMSVLQRSLDLSDHNNIMLWAACCFGFLRAGEFTVNSAFDPTLHLALADVQVDSPLNLQSFRVFIKCSKTNPFRMGLLRLSWSSLRPSLSCGFLVKLPSSPWTATWTSLSLPVWHFPF